MNSSWNHQCLQRLFVYKDVYREKLLLNLDKSTSKIELSYCWIVDLLFFSCSFTAFIMPQISAMSSFFLATVPWSFKSTGHFHSIAQNYFGLFEPSNILWFLFLKQNQLLQCCHMSPMIFRTIFDWRKHFTKAHNCLQPPMLL